MSVIDELKAWLRKEVEQVENEIDVYSNENNDMTFQHGQFRSLIGALDKLEKLQAREFNAATAANTIKELMDIEEREGKE